MHDTSTACCDLLIYWYTRTLDTIILYWYPRYIDALITVITCTLTETLHGYTNARTTAFHVYISLLHMHVIFLYPCYTCIYGVSILVIWSPVHISCIIVPCYRIHVIWLFPVTDMDIPDTGHESCWYVICGLPHLLFPFPVILFMLYCSRFPLYCSMLSTELRSSYHVTRIIYCIYSCYIVY